VESTVLVIARYYVTINYYYYCHDLKLQYYAVVFSNEHF